jgi:dTDP-4-dehydrorhamnose 3,5-epimerase
LKTTITPTRLTDVLLVRIDYFQDERGFFIENWTRRAFREAGLDVDFVQDNHSRSGGGVLRGMHYQDTTAPMGKLVRCSVGQIFDVAVDLRVGSPTFGQWVGCELTEDNMEQLWVPPGFAHGFVVLSESADVHYKCSGYYTPAAEGTLAWNDPEVGVPWPVTDPQVSERDSRGMSLDQYLRRSAFTFPAGEAGQD